MVLQVPKLSKKLSLKGRVRTKEMFPETISFGDYSFYFFKNLNAVFQDLFASNNKILILARRLGTRLSFYEVYTLS